MAERIRLHLPTEPVPAWTIQFADGGSRYRFVRPEAAAEIIGQRNEARRLHYRQPDDDEITQLAPGRSLRERGQWMITRTEVLPNEFGAHD